MSTRSSVEKINSVQRRIKVSVESKIVDDAFKAAYAKIGRKVKIDGFRMGKAPVSVISKLYGERVSPEVADALIQTNLLSALTENNVQPVASPVIEKADLPAKGSDYEFTAVVDIMPEIEIDKYAGVAVSITSVKATDEMVGQELRRLQREHANAKAAEEGDVAGEGFLATISHTASLEGKDLPEFNVKSLEFAIGFGEIQEELEKAVVGMKIGDAKDADVKLPADYGAEDLAGKSLKFNIQLEALRRLEVPELNDDFAKDIEFESLEALKKSVEDALQRQFDQNKDRHIEHQILQSIKQSNPFEVPPSMVDQITDSMISGMRWPSEEKRQEALGNKEIREQLRDEAKNKAKNSLILWFVSKKEKIEVTDEVVNKELDTIMGQLGGQGGNRKQIESMFKAKIQEDLLFTKVLRFLKSSAVITEIDSK